MQVGWEVGTQPSLDLPSPSAQREADKQGAEASRPNPSKVHQSSSVCALDPGLKLSHSTEIWNLWKSGQEPSTYSQRQKPLSCTGVRCGGLTPLIQPKGFVSGLYFMASAPAGGNKAITVFPYHSNGG